MKPTTVTKKSEKCCSAVFKNLFLGMINSTYTHE